MATKSIEGRSYIYARSHSSTTISRFRDLENAYKSGATEQDRIARQEERERCISAAQHWLCRSCCETCYSKHNISACYKGKAIRKAIEKGGDV